MPNAATYNVDHVMRGPGQLWLNVALPANNARLKLKANGAPDDIESPNAIFMGMTEAGTKFVETFNEEPEECDEFGRYRDAIAAEAAHIEGSLLEFLDFVKMLQLQPNATLVQVAAGAGQKKVAQLKFGGKLIIPNVPVALIVPRVEDPELFTVVQLYAAHNTAGISLDVTKKKSAAVPFKLEARIVPSRVAGDNLATIWTEEDHATA